MSTTSKKSNQAKSTTAKKTVSKAQTAKVASKKSSTAVKSAVKSNKAVAPSKTGTIQFRLDADKTELLNEVALEKRTGAGVLARLWVLERLEKETSGTAQFEPMLALADSIKALAGAIGVDSNAVRQKFEQFDKQVKASTKKAVPQAKAFGKKVSKKLDAIESDLKEKYGVPTKDDVSKELHKRLDKLEQIAKDKYGISLPNAEDFKAELHKRADLLEQVIKEKTGLSLPSVDDISSQVSERVAALEALLKAKTGVSLPRIGTKKHLPKRSTRAKANPSKASHTV